MPPTILNLSMNAFVRPYLAFYVVFINLKLLFVNFFNIEIHILEVLCTHAGDPNCTHDICIVFVYPIFNNYFNHFFNCFHGGIYLF